MAVESKAAEQKLQKTEDSRRKNEKMAKQVEKVLNYFSSLSGIVQFTC